MRIVLSCYRGPRQITEHRKRAKDMAAALAMALCALAALAAAQDITDLVPDTPTIANVTHSGYAYFRVSADAERGRARAGGGRVGRAGPCARVAATHRPRRCCSALAETKICP
jgi:hypothetical protein